MYVVLSFLKLSLVFERWQEVFFGAKEIFLKLSYCIFLEKRGEWKAPNFLYV